MKRRVIAKFEIRQLVRVLFVLVYDIFEMIDAIEKLFGYVHVCCCALGIIAVHYLLVTVSFLYNYSSLNEAESDWVKQNVQRLNEQLVFAIPQLSHPFRPFRSLSVSTLRSNCSTFLFLV
jgi:hypothetical protein